MRRGFSVPYYDANYIGNVDVINAMKDDWVGFAFFGHGYPFPWQDLRGSGRYYEDSETTTLISPGSVASTHRYTLAILFNCAADYEDWNSIIARYGRAYVGHGLLSSMAGARTFDYWGSWDSLVSGVLNW